MQAGYLWPLRPPLFIRGKLNRFTTNRKIGTFLRIMRIVPCTYVRQRLILDLHETIWGILYSYARSSIWRKFLFIFTFWKFILIFQRILYHRTFPIYFLMLFGENVCVCVCVHTTNIIISAYIIRMPSAIKVTHTVY